MLSLQSSASELPKFRAATFCPNPDFLSYERGNCHNSLLCIQQLKVRAGVAARPILDAATSSGILKAKQKLGVTFNFDKQDVIDFTKFSKIKTCWASEANS